MFIASAFKSFVLATRCKQLDSPDIVSTLKANELTLDDSTSGPALADALNRDCPTHRPRREAEHAAVLVTEAWQCRVARALPGLRDRSAARALRTSARHRSCFVISIYRH